MDGGRAEHDEILLKEPGLSVKLILSPQAGLATFAWTGFQHIDTCRGLRSTSAQEPAGPCMNPPPPPIQEKKAELNEEGPKATPPAHVLWRGHDVIVGSIFY